MRPEYILIHAGKSDQPDYLVHLTATGREPMEMVKLSTPATLFATDAQLHRFEYAVDGSAFLLSPRNEHQGPYLQRILLHSLRNPGLIGMGAMFVEHCRAAGVTGTATQLLKTSDGKIFILTVKISTDYDAQWTVLPVRENTLFTHGAMLTYEQIEQQFILDHQARMDRINDAFNPLSENGFTMPSFES